MKTLTMFTLLVLSCSFLFAGEETQKDASQKSPMQKNDAFQKGDVEVSGRSRSRRRDRVAARREAWASAVCHSGHCR